MKKCYCCGKTKDYSEFYKNKSKHDGYASECRECNKKYAQSEKGRIVCRNAVRKHRQSKEGKEKRKKYRQTVEFKEADNKRNRDYRRRNTEKKSAQDKIKWAIKTGKIIKPLQCSLCKEDLPKNKIHGHHEDYNKPLEVIWCCTQCHKNIHLEKICLLK